MNKEKLEVFYFKNYKKLMLIPIIILVLALIVTAVFYAQNGDFFTKDVSLKGGVSATVDTEAEVEIDALEKHLGVDANIRRLTDFGTGRQLGYIIDVSDISGEDLEESLEEFFGLELDERNYSSNETGARFGAAFNRQLLVAVLLAFLFMAVVVFITFRTVAPSLAVVFAAFIDIAVPLAIINLFHIPVSSAGIIGFLLVIGYSIDTDILLTTAAIRKREGTLFIRMFNAMKTGLTMSATAIAVMLVGIIFSASVVIKEMFTIILIALLVDIVATYLTNTGILMWYCQKKGIR